MLIVCPSCATSYMIDQASFGPAGRTVRCARCKVTWVAGEPKSTSDVTAFVDSVIADAGAQSTPLARTEAAPLPTAAAPPPPSAQAAAADVGAEDSESITATDSKAPPVEPPPPEPAPAETPPAAAGPPQAVAPLVALDRDHSRAGRFQRRAARRAQRRGALPAADRFAVCGHRPAGQPAQSQIRERQDFEGNPGRHQQPDRGRRHCE